MKLVEHKCPNCDATVRTDAAAREVACEHCGHVFRVEGAAASPAGEGKPPEPGDQARTAQKKSNTKLVWIIVLVVLVVVLVAVVGPCIFLAGFVSDAASEAKEGLSSLDLNEVQQGLVRDGGPLGAKRTRKVQGSMTSSGGELGDFTIPLTGCRGGEGSGFFGVDVFTDGDARPRLRYYRDPTRGEMLTVTIPGTDRGLVIGPEDCEVLEGEINRRGYGGGGHTTLWAFDGKLTFECAHSGGQGTVEGSMTFQSCM